MTGATAIGQEQLCTVCGEGQRWWPGRGILLGQPVSKAGWLHNHYGEAHQRVRRAAELSADATKNASARRLQHQAGTTPWNHVDLAAKRRNPEGVKDVGAV